MPLAVRFVSQVAHRATISLHHFTRHKAPPPGRNTNTKTAYSTNVQRNSFNKTTAGHVKNEHSLPSSVTIQFVSICQQYNSPLHYTACQYTSTVQLTASLHSLLVHVNSTTHRLTPQLASTCQQYNSPLHYTACQYMSTVQLTASLHSLPVHFKSTTHRFTTQFASTCQQNTLHFNTYLYFLLNSVSQSRLRRTSLRSLTEIV